MKCLYSNKKGFTLVELVITITLVGILALVTYPMMSTGVDAITMAYDANNYNQQVRIFYSYMRNVMKNDVTLTAINSDGFSYNIGADSYDISVAGFPGTPPFNAMLTKNGGTPSLLLEGLAQLAGPNRPGFEVSYRDQFNQTTAVISNVWSISIRTTFQGRSHTFDYNTRIFIPKFTEIIAP